MEYKKYLRGTLAGLCLAGVLSCGSSNSLRNDENYEIAYTDYRRIKIARGDSVMSEERFYELFDKLIPITQLNKQLEYADIVLKKMISRPAKKDSTLAQMIDSN